MKGTQKVTLSLPPGLLDEFREHAQMTNLSAFLAHAMRDEIRYTKVDKKTFIKGYDEGFKAGFEACNDQMLEQAHKFLKEARATKKETPA